MTLATVKSVRMQPNSMLVPASADPVIGVMHQRVETDARGRHVLKGELVNQSGNTVNIPHVLATYYDNAGKVIWVSDGYVDQALLPQTPVPFAVDLRDDLAANVHNYRVTVNQYMLDRATVNHDDEPATLQKLCFRSLLRWLSALAHAADLKRAGDGACRSRPQHPDLRQRRAQLCICVGPGTAIKRKVQLGQDVQLSADELEKCRPLYDLAGSARQRDILRHRGAGQLDRFSGAAFARACGYAQRYQRHSICVRQVSEPGLQPQPVKFELNVNGQTSAAPRRRKAASRTPSWIRRRKEGPAQFVASSGTVSIRRVVQEVASDPCNIRMRARSATRTASWCRPIPIRDCAGNPVPDGTIVTFTSTGSTGQEHRGCPH